MIHNGENLVRPFLVGNEVYFSHAVELKDTEKIKIYLLGELVEQKRLFLFIYLTLF